MGLSALSSLIDAAAHHDVAPARDVRSWYSLIIRSDQAELLAQTMAKPGRVPMRTRLNHVQQEVIRRTAGMFPNREFK
jgi:hypothetical protein